MGRKKKEDEEYSGDYYASNYQFTHNGLTRHIYSCGIKYTLEQLILMAKGALKHNKEKYIEQLEKDLVQTLQNYMHQFQLDHPKTKDDTEKLETGEPLMPEKK